MSQYLYAAHFYPKEVVVGPQTVTATGIASSGVMGMNSTRWWGTGVADSQQASTSLAGPGDTTFTSVVRAVDTYTTNSDIHFAYGASTSYVQWTTTQAHPDYLLFRFDLTLPATVPTTFQICSILDASSTVINRFAIVGSTLKLRVQNFDGSVSLGDSTWSFTPGVRYTLQVRFAKGASSNAIRINAYETGTGSLLGTLNIGAATQAGTNQINRVRFGSLFTATAGQEITLGDFGWADTNGLDTSEEISWLNGVVPGPVTVISSAIGIGEIRLLASNAVEGTSNTSFTVTLPAYTLENYIVLIAASSAGVARTFSANVTATILDDAGSSRLTAYRIVPVDGSQTSFTFTVSSSTQAWWIGTYQGINPAATVIAETTTDTNTTAYIAALGTSLGYTTGGDELNLAAASVPSIATWSPTTDSLHYSTSGSAALHVKRPDYFISGLTAIPTVDFSRGSEGVSRNESTVNLVFVPDRAKMGTPTVALAATAIRVGGFQVEALEQGAPVLQVGQFVVEALVQSVVIPDLRVGQVVVEALLTAAVNLRVGQVVVEVLVPPSVPVPMLGYSLGGGYPGIFPVQPGDASGAGVPGGAINLVPGGIAALEAIPIPAITTAVTVTPTDIATMEVFGTLTVTTGGVTVTPSSIATAEVVGSHAVGVGAVVLTPSGIATGEAFGTSVVTRGAVNVTPTGIPTAETSGTHSITTGTATVVPTGIGTAAAFGTLTVATGVTTVAPIGIVDTVEVLGIPTVVQGTVTLTPSGIPTAEVSGTASVGTSTTVTATGIPTGESLGSAAIYTTVVLQVAGIPTTEALGTASITAGALAIGPEGIGTTETVASPVLVGGQVFTWGVGTLGSAYGAGVYGLVPFPLDTTVGIVPSSITSGQAFGTPQITTGVTTVAVSGIPTVEALGTPSVTVGTVTLTVTGIATGLTFGVPVVVTGVFDVFPSAIPSGETFGTLTVTTSGVVVTVGGIATSQAFGTASLSSSISGTTTGIPTAETVSSPVLSSVTAVSPAGIPTGQQFGGPSLGSSTAITPAGVPSGETFGSAAVNTIVSLQVTGIPSAAVFGSATVGQTSFVVPTGIPTAEVFGAASVTGGVSLTPTGIPSGETFGTALVWLSAVTMTPTGIPSDAVVGTPTVGLRQVVSPAGIGSTRAYGTPTVVVSGLTIIVTGIESGEIIPAPVLWPGAVSITLTGIPGAAAVGQHALWPGALPLQVVGIPSGEQFGSAAMTRRLYASVGVLICDILAVP